MRENKFQNDFVIPAFKKKAVFIINLHGHAMQRAGLPDLEIIHRKWHGFLELKVGPERLKKNRPSDIQRKVAQAIAVRGVPVYVLRCVEADIDIDILCCEMFRYTLEDFDGKVIRRDFELHELLQILIDLEETTCG